MSSSRSSSLGGGGVGAGADVGGAGAVVGAGTENVCAGAQDAADGDGFQSVADGFIVSISVQFSSFRFFSLSWLCKKLYYVSFDIILIYCLRKQRCRMYTIRERVRERFQSIFGLNPYNNNCITRSKKTTGQDAKYYMHSKYCNV